jgi:hypothetical protein
MSLKFIRLVIAVLFIVTVNHSVFSQETNVKAKKADVVIDSLKKSGVIISGSIKRPDINLSKSQSVKFLQQRLQPQYWRDTQNPLRRAIGQIVYEATHPQYDSTEMYLKTYPFDSIRVPWDKFYIWEPLKVKIASEAVAPLTTADTMAVTDTTSLAELADSLNLVKLQEIVSQRVVQNDQGIRDTSVMVVLDTLKEVTVESPLFPFKSYTYPFQGDSIEVAVNSLIKFLNDRDSTIVNFTGAGGNVTPFLLNSRSGRVERFWLKNDFSDSVTVWIGNHSRDTIGLYLESGVSFRRPMKQQNYSDAKMNIQTIDNSRLLNAKRIYVKQQFWKYRSEASLIFSQTALTNWVKGGENSLSAALDVTGYADYNNKFLKLSSNNFMRLKLGFLKSGDNDVRKNLDLIETNSKLNHKAFGKFDFSAIMLFKTQVAPGYSYSSDPPDMVSKFLNPAILTLGFGLDYKPDKVTSINFSPFSYKGTYVTDTVEIDQTKYGIPHGKKSINEPGASFMITNEYNKIKNVVITNRLQLFTNYIHNPLNIDIDWEMIVVMHLNWFTDIRFNSHLIFDDDTKTVVLDDKKNPVLRPDGTQMKTARAQFKEMLGFSLVFRF